jgi:hypothetical protein
MVTMRRSFVIMMGMIINTSSVFLSTGEGELMSQRGG